MKKVLIFIVLLLLFSPAGAVAQQFQSGVAVSITLTDKNVQDGDIISQSNGKYLKANTEYDQNIFAVVASPPAVAIEATKLPNQVTVVTSGKGNVRVSTKTGSIKIGDYITSSTTPGVGEKATQVGYVLGTALENYSAKNPNDIGKILVALSPHYNTDISGAKYNLLANLKSASASPFLSPLTSLRYLLAVLVSAIAFASAFFYFGRIAKTGIEALGRNPLAASDIRISVIFNVALTILIMIVGLAMAYFILVL